MSYCMVHSAFKTSSVCIVNEANFRDRECNKNNIIHPHTLACTCCVTCHKKVSFKICKAIRRRLKQFCCADPHTHIHLCRAIERVFNSATETGSR